MSTIITFDRRQRTILPAAPPPSQEACDRETIRAFAAEHPSAFRLLVSETLRHTADLLAERITATDPANTAGTR